MVRGRGAGTVGSGVSAFGRLRFFLQGHSLSRHSICKGVCQLSVRSLCGSLRVLVGPLHGWRHRGTDNTCAPGLVSCRLHTARGPTPSTSMLQAYCMMPCLLHACQRWLCSYHFMLCDADRSRYGCIIGACAAVLPCLLFLQAV